MPPSGRSSSDPGATAPAPERGLDPRTPTGTAYRSPRPFLERFWGSISMPSPGHRDPGVAHARPPSGRRGWPGSGARPPWSRWRDGSAAERRGRRRLAATRWSASRSPAVARQRGGRVDPWRSRRSSGIETEYGILIRGGESNPIAASSILINAYVQELARAGAATGRLADRVGLRGRAAGQRRPRLQRRRRRCRRRWRRTS